MKKVGLYLIITFVIYFIGQLFWILTIYCNDPLFGYEYLETLFLIQIYSLSGIFGLLSGIQLYQLNR